MSARSAAAATVAKRHHKEEDDSVDETKPVAPAAAAAKSRSETKKRNSSTSHSSNNATIPDLKQRILIRGSERITLCLQSDFALPTSLVDWHEKQKERSAGRISGFRTLEKAMSEFKTIRCNDYMANLLSGTDKHEDQGIEDVCLCEDEQCDYRCINRGLQIECTPDICKTCAKGKDCGNQRMSRANKKKIEARLVDDKGIGMFAMEPIPSGHYVHEYVGEVISEKECMRRLAHEYVEEKHKYLMNMSGGLIIDATRKGNTARFINHSCEPNCRVQEWKVRGERRMGIFSIRSIAPGQELSFNYNFQRFGEGFQACRCGAPSCIGLLGRDKQGVGNNTSSAGQGKLLSLFPRGFFTQKDSARKVENFLLEVMECGVPEADVKFARTEGVFLVRNVRKAMEDEYLNQA